MRRSSIVGGTALTHSASGGKQIPLFPLGAYSRTDDRGKDASGVDPEVTWQEVMASLARISVDAYQTSLDPVKSWQPVHWWLIVDTTSDYTAAA